MKKIVYSVLLLSAIVFWQCSHPEPKILFEYVNPLQKVFPDNSYFPSADARADVARGENASFQFVVRGSESIEGLEIKVKPLKKNDKLLDQVKTGFVELVKIGRSYAEPSIDRYEPTSVYFPDPIIYKKSKDVSFGISQPLWVSVKIPEGQEPGTYSGTVTITGKVDGRKFEKSRDLTIKVYKPVIGKTSLWVTNWFFDQFQYLNNGNKVEKYSDLYWQLWRVMAKMMAEYRQNVALISPLDLTAFTFENNRWSFDFSNFNKLVKLFVEEGVIGRLEGGHLGSRVDGGWTSQFGLFVPVPGNKTTSLKVMTIDDPETKRFYTAFMPALMENIKSQGWKDIYIQHIADEPIEENVSSYKAISKFVRSISPDLKIIEACHSNKLDNEVNIWVPQLNFLSDSIDFYKKRQAKGDEVWFYTCLYPQGKYPNRFIDQQLIQMRMLHWINFKYGITGYLHWGYNYWRNSASDSTDWKSPYGETSVVNGNAGQILPGGDSWIVYPGEKTLYPSIRLEAMRDGIVDYELLKMFKERYPEEADKMVHLTVTHMKRFNSSIEDFCKNRRTILEKLSE